MKNREALELFNTLNSVKAEVGSKLEYAQMKTLRNMNTFVRDYNQKMEDINNDNVATFKNENGVEIILTETLTKTNKDGSSEEVKIPTYTKEGNKKRAEQKRKFDEQEAEPFKIYQTTDVSKLKAWEKEVLTELNFILVETAEVIETS